MDIVRAKQTIRGIRALMVENKDRLIELDSAMGDGDLGLTMVKAFANADEQLSATEDTDIGRYFAQAGMQMAKAAPSTMGTLVGSGFMRGGKALRDKPTLEPVDIASFFRAFTDGLIERGKSKLGDKTIIDLFDPVSSALEEAVASGGSFGDLSETMRSSGKAALVAIEGMMSQRGKAAIYREQTKGKPDPGATAGYLIVEGFARELERM